MTENRKGLVNFQLNLNNILKHPSIYIVFPVSLKRVLISDDEHIYFILDNGMFMPCYMDSESG